VPRGQFSAELEEYARLRGEKKALEGRMAETENRLKAALGDAERGEAGRFSVLWRTQKRRSFQAKAFGQAHPELDLAPFYKETETRALRIAENE
jgi:predicted phage-related endonuclease